MYCRVTLERLAIAAPGLVTLLVILIKSVQPTRYKDYAWSVDSLLSILFNIQHLSTEGYILMPKFYHYHCKVEGE